MLTTCPNCSRALRSGAQFCGYCGANILSIARVEQSVPAASDESLNTLRGKSKKSIEGKRRDPGRVVAIIAIVLLFLIIGLSLAVQFWSVIFPWFERILSSLIAT